MSAKSEGGCSKSETGVRRPEREGDGMRGALPVLQLVEGVNTGTPPEEEVEAASSQSRLNVPFSTLSLEISFSISLDRTRAFKDFLVIPEQQAPLSRWWTSAEGDVKCLLQPFPPAHAILPRG